MNDGTQKSQTETTPQPESDSALSRASAIVGIISAVLYFAPIFVKLLFGSNRLALTAYGEHLYQIGFSYPLAAALDPTPLMRIGSLIAIIGFVIGMISVFRKGRKRLAKVGIYTSGIVIMFVLLLPAL